VRMWDGVMKFAYAWTFAGQPCDETPAPPPGKRAPHRRTCRAAPCSAKWASASSKLAGASSAPCLRTFTSNAASASRLANMSLAPIHTSPPSQNGTTSACQTRPHRTRHALETCIGPRISHVCPACESRVGPPHPNRLASARWRASEVGFSNSGLRPSPAQGIRRRTLDFVPWSKAIKRIRYCLNHSARAANSGVMAFTPLSLAPAKPR
jgi:hypothetical protein